VRIILRQEIPDDAILAHQWNELAQQMECPEVFYTHEWALAVSHAYHALLKPVLMLAYEGDSLVGVAALAVDSSRTKVVFLAGTTADYCDFVSAPQSRIKFVELVLQELRHLKIPAVFANLPADSATTAALDAVAHLSRYSMFSQPACCSAQVALSTPQQKEDVKRQVKGKQMLRRHLKTMAKAGPVEICHLKVWEDVAAALPAFEQAHISRFLDSGRVSNIASAQRRVFLAELARSLSRRGWFNLTCLKVGSEIAAWNYGFEFAGSWFWYQPTFNSRFREWYPGLCMLAKIVEEACERPEINRVDLGLGTEGYKQRFATASRQTLDVALTTSKARHLKEIVRYHTVSAIKSSPPLEHYMRRLLGRPRAGEVRA
jgi:CelD/BcsL family acetyltransferase involved in cellulose biosynthesis